jgi:hypothetical protein
MSVGRQGALDLSTQIPRRIGLSRSHGPSGGCQPKDKYASPTPSDSPPPKAFKKPTLEEPKQNEVEEDIMALPASDGSDDELDRQRQNIKPSNNIGRKEKTEKKAGLREGRVKGPTINGNLKSAKAAKEPTPLQDNSPSSPKRKSQEELEGGAFARKRRVKTQAKYVSQSSQGKSGGRNAVNAKPSSLSQGS